MDRETLKKQIKEFEHTTELAVALLIATLLATGVAYGSIGSGDLTSSHDYLIAEYRFDTGASDTAYDTAGNNDGTLQNLDFDGDSGWTSGIRGKALEFDGSDDYVSITDSASLDIGTDGLTVGGWIYLREDSDSNNWMLFDKGTSQSGTYYLYNDGNNFRMTVKDGSNRYDATASSSIVPQNQWVFVVGTYDESEVSLWMNGEKVASTSAPANLGSNSKPVWIGEYQGGGYELDGKVDSARIYSTALNKSQIKSLYNSGSWRIGTATSKDSPSKVLDISFQHQNSSYVLDTSGYNNHGEIYGNAKQEDAVSCKVGRCYGFDGSSGTGVDLNDIWSDHTQSRTFMFWFKEAESGAQNGDRIITQDCSEWFCLTDNGKNSIVTGVDGYSSAPSYSLDQSKWHHASLVFNESNSVFTFYLNGENKTSIDYSSGWSHGTRPVVLAGNTEGPDDISGDQWEGRIDNLKIFNRSLSQAEIIEKTPKLQGGGTVLDLRFNRNGGDKAHDYSGEKNHGTLQPNASAGPKWVDGVTGNALEFDGNDDGIHVAGTESLTSQDPFSVSLWAKIRKGSEKYGGIVSKEEGSNSDWAFYRYKTTDDLSFYTDNAAGHLRLDDKYFDWGEWEHFTVAWDGSTKKIFVNGDLKVSESSTGSVGTTSDIGIGVSLYNGVDTRNMKGKIDNVKIYPYAISKSKVQQLYSRGKSHIGSSSDSNPDVNLQKGLVLSQTFNRIETCGQSDTVSCPSGMNGKVAVDESGEANHGELVNGPSKKLATKCRIGQCLSFDGSDDNVQGSIKGAPLNAEKRTLSLWVKADSASGKAGVFNYGTASQNQVFGLLKSGGDWIYQLWGGSYDNNTGVSVDPDTWHHHVLTYNGTHGNYFYDGELRHSSKGIEPATSGTDFVVGREKDGDDWFKGTVDSIRLYNRSLSKKEIWKLYTRGRDRQGGMAGAVAHYRLMAGKVGTKENPGVGCKQIHSLRPAAGNGVYWINPDDAGGVSKFQVYCNMSSGGWMQFQMRSVEGGCGDLNNMIWFTKGSSFYDESQHWPDGSGENDTMLEEIRQVDAKSDICSGNPDYIFSGSDPDDSSGWKRGLEVNWSMYSNLNYVYTDRQMDAVRRQITQLSSQTKMHAETNDDDTCATNGEVYLYNGLGRDNRYNSTHITSSSEKTAWNEEYTGGSNGGGWKHVIKVAPDASYYLPSKLDLQNAAYCSGETEFVGWGYDANYTMVRDGGPSGIYDSSGEANWGSLKGDPKWATGKSGRALRFDGNDDYVKVAAEGGIDSNLGSSYTISAWVYPTGDSSANNPGIIVKGPKNNNGQIQMEYREASDERAIRFLYEYQTGDAHYFDSSPGSVPLNKWTHITFTMNSSGRYIYVDGRLENSDTSDTSQEYSGYDWYIGQKGGSYFGGKIDDVRIYPYALSGEQVRKVMNGGGVSVGG